MAGRLSFMIVGTARSGTTLIQRLTTELPGVAVPPETHFFSHHARGLLRRARFPLVGDELADEVRRYHAIESRRGLAFDPGAVIDRLGGRCPSVAAMFEAVVCTLTGDAPVSGEKTPEHLFWWRPLSRARPDVRFVAVVRDPRAVVASNLAVPFGMDWDEVLAQRWRADQREVLAAAEQLGPDRFLVLRYEDVVADAGGTRTRLAEHLGVSVTTGAASASGTAAPLYQDWELWKRRVDTDVVTSRIDAWRDELPVRSAARVVAACRPEMHAFGYTAGPGGRLHDAWRMAGLSPRAQGRRAWYRWRRRRTASAIARARL